MAGRLKILILVVGSVAAACATGDNPTVGSSELVVIQGYLQAGTPIRDIMVSSTLNLGSRDSLSPPIDNARVQIIRNDVCYVLEKMIGKRGSYGMPKNPYEGEDEGPGLRADEGDRLRLEVLYFDKIASASTVVPPVPGNLSAASNTIFVPADTTGTVISEKGSITLAWTGDGDHWYFVEMWNLESFPESIWGGPPVSRGPIIRSEPFADHSYRITWRDLTHYGRWWVKVYTVNLEYVEMFRTRNQDSRDLNEPITNVTNGLGIFTALNSESLDFKVVKE